MVPDARIDREIARGELDKPTFADICARNKEAGEAATRAWWAQREREIALETFGPLERYTPANDNWPKVIAFTGKAGSGKSTAAKYVMHRGYKLIKFADPLKDMLRAIGYNQQQIEGDLKEVVDSSGQTPRHAMQTLGTEWGRKCMGEDFWINIWRERVTGGTSVTDDCRFANEADAVRKAGGIVIMLEGRGGINSSHSSENLDFEPDIVVANDGNIASLHAEIDSILAA